MTQEVQREARIYAVTDGELAMLEDFSWQAIFTGALGGIVIGAGLAYNVADWVSLAFGAFFLLYAASFSLSARKVVKRIRQESKDRTS